MTTTARVIFACTIALGACTENRPPEDRAGPTLTHLSTYTLQEADSSFLARPSTLTVRASDGAFIVADMVSNRVSFYKRTGELISRIGRPGRGPGELLGPAATIQIRDSLLAIYNMGLRGLVVFDAATGTYIRNVSLPGFPSYYVPDHFTDTVWIPSRNTATGKAILSWVPSTDSVAEHYDLPKEYTRYGEAMRFSGTPLAMSGDTLVVGFSPFNPILVIDRGRGTADTIDIPARLRRGTALGAFQHPSTDLGDLLSRVSTVEAIERLPSGYFSIVHFDKFSPAPDIRRILAKVYLSVVDLAGRRACLDQEVPAKADGLPVVRLRADTLFLLAQAVRDSIVTTRVDSYRIGTEQCAWRTLQHAQGFM